MLETGGLTSLAWGRTGSSRTLARPRRPCRRNAWFEKEKKFKGTGSGRHTSNACLSETKWTTLSKKTHEMIKYYLQGQRGAPS